MEVLMGTLIFSFIVVTTMLVSRNSFMLAKSMEERILILSDSSFPRHLISNFLQYNPYKPYIAYNRISFYGYRMNFSRGHFYRELTNEQHQPILVYDSPLYHRLVQASFGGEIMPIKKEGELYSLRYQVMVDGSRGPVDLGQGWMFEPKPIYTVDMKFLPLYKYYGMPDSTEGR